MSQGKEVAGNERSWEQCRQKARRYSVVVEAQTDDGEARNRRLQIQGG